MYTHTQITRVSTHTSHVYTLTHVYTHTHTHVYTHTHTHVYTLTHTGALRPFPPLCRLRHLPPHTQRHRRNSTRPLTLQPLSPTKHLTLQPLSPTQPLTYNRFPLIPSSYITPNITTAFPLYPTPNITTAFPLYATRCGWLTCTTWSLSPSAAAQASLALVQNPKP